MIKFLTSDKHFCSLYECEIKTETLLLQKNFLIFIIVVYGSFIALDALVDWIFHKTVNASSIAGCIEVLIAVLLLFIFRFYIERKQTGVTVFFFISIFQFLLATYIQYTFMPTRSGFYLLILAFVSTSVSVIYHNGLYFTGLAVLMLHDVFYTYQALSSCLSEVFHQAVENLIFLFCAVFINICLTMAKRKEIMSRVRLIEERDTDSLTGLLNRNAAQRSIVQYLGKNSLQALLLLDLDGFKQINDTLGHQMGDILLQEVAKVIGTIFRSSDITARLGGDEFLLFMDNLSSETIPQHKAKLLIDRVSAIAVGHKKKTSVSCSVGIAFTSKHENDSFEELYKKADRALYQSKWNGKACYTVMEASQTIISRRTSC